MDLIELGSALAAFFDRDSDGTWPGPSHDELDVAVRRAGLEAYDPRRESSQVGKMKRVRQLLVAATDQDPSAGLALALQIVMLLRSSGAFAELREDGTTPTKLAALQRSFDALGYEMDASGAVRPKVIDNLSGTELTAALKSYITRMNLNPDDEALQLGTAKDLDEATARHVLVERGVGYAVGAGGSYAVTLAQAFSVLGFAVPPKVDLDADPHRQVQQCLFLLSVAVNRLRNHAGTGHGRPNHSAGSTPLIPSEARVVSRASALVAGALLDAL